MNNLQIFDNQQFGQVRTAMIDDKIYFVAVDVAKSLGYKNTNDAINRHCKGVVKHEGYKINGIEVSLIPEGDIYRLAAKSELPGAEKFESWIFDEVLPQIRKTGGYIPSNENDSDEDIMAKALLIAQNKIKLKNKAIEEKDKQLIEQQPKVIFADAVAASKSSILVGELAKLLRQNGVDIGEKRLFKWLRDNGYLIKRKGTDYNMPTQKSADLELFEVKETSIAHSDGHTSISKTPKVKGKGQIYFINKFKEFKNLN